MSEEQEVEILINGVIIKGKFVSAESKFHDVPPKNGWQVLGPRESVTITVKVDG